MRRLSKLSRRLAGVLLTAAAIASGITALATAPASAGQSFTIIARSSSAYTDATEPFASFTQGSDAPVGAWRDADGKHHISKAYFTFDLSAFRNSHIGGAAVVADETAATDCATPRATEAWQTNVAEQPQWANQPAELAKLSLVETPTSCTASGLTWVATEAIREAIASGSTKVTVALRMSEDVQGDTAYGRRFANNVRLQLYYNNAPDTPTNMSVIGKACDSSPLFVPNVDAYLTATYRDPDFDYVSGHISLSNVNDPAQRYETTTNGGYGSYTGSVFVPRGFLVDGATYEWTAQSDDQDAVSPVSEPCRFTTDFTAPNVAPGVSSTDYPENASAPGTGGGAIPGMFTFTANGVSDVVGYYYNGPTSSGYVAANHLGGDATASIVPGREGLTSISVRSEDRAGNLSPSREYRMWVRETTPVVTSTPTNGGLGTPREFTFAPRMENVVEFTYRFNNGPEVTLPAAADGTAKVTLTPDRQDNTLIVWSTNRDGLRSGTNTLNLYVDGAAPNVVSADYPTGQQAGGVGVPGTFTFTPRMPDVVEYEYRLNYESVQKVTAAPDGSATVVITPTRTGWQRLSVASINAAGIRSEWRYYTFGVLG